MASAVIIKQSVDCASGQDVCVVCYREAEIYSIGECDHPVCHECSTRMRVLCNQTECPICRKDMALVVFMKVIQLFSKIRYQTMKYERRYSIYFESDVVMRAYDKLLEHICSICDKPLKFTSFSLLKDHMRKVHENFYCELCVENLRIFTHERKVYTRSNLAKHRRIGDLDDTSHRGHPLCEFCDSRFMDNDELFRHLRRDHYYCHFCDADGLHHYYMDYNALRDHFATGHFLCEEEDCKEERFTSAFRTKIDLQAHKAQNHSQKMSRLESRQVRTVELAFNSNLGDRMSRGTRKEDKKRRPLQDNDDQEMAAQAIAPTTIKFKKQEAININCAQNFPSLGNLGSGLGGDGDNSAATKSIAHRLAKNSGMTIRNARGNAFSQEEFPSLSSSALGNSSGPQSPPVASKSSASSSSKIKSTKVISNGQINSKNDGKLQLSSSTSSQKKGNASKNLSVSSSNLSTDDFPTLPAGKSLNNSVSKTTASWVPHGSSSTNSSKSKNPTEINNNNTKQSANKDSNYCLKSDFPCLKSNSNQASNKVSKNGTGKPKVSKDNPLCSQNNKKKKDNTNLNDVKLLAQANGSKDKKEKNTSKAYSKGRNNSTNQTTGKNTEENVLTDTVSLKNKKKKSYSVLSMSEIDEFDDGPKEDLSCARQGDYESIIPLLSSNINLVTLDDIPGNNKKNGFANEIKPDFSASDFPSLSANSLSSSNKKNNLPSSSKLISTAVLANSTSAKTKKQNGPPPGFAQEQKQTENNLNKSSSSQKRKNLIYSYSLPPNFDVRNRALIDSVKIACGDSGDKFNSFKFIADKFRKNEFSGEHFYKLCRSTMGALAFLAILPEFLAVLPDIQKQQELLKAYREMDAGKGCNTCFAVCAVCQQVLIHDDFSSHMTVHDFSS